MRPNRMMLRTAVLLAAFTMVTGTAAATASRAVASPAQSYNGLALTPPMGFNNWAGFECNNRFGEKLFLDTADAMVRLGLDKLGYNQVNIDDWPTPRSHRAPRSQPTFTGPNVPSGTADNVAGGGVTVKLSG